jgi:hypothetical protein
MRECDNSKIHIRSKINISLETLLEFCNVQYTSKLLKNLKKKRCFHHEVRRTRQDQHSYCSTVVWLACSCASVSRKSRYSSVGKVVGPRAG